jgi:hypothetical protein
LGAIIGDLRSKYVSWEHHQTNQPQENKPMTATHAGGMMELSSDFFLP